MANERTSPILYIIATVLCINLIATLWIGFKIPSHISSNTNEISQITTKLPIYITKDVKKQILSDFIKSFNSGNKDIFYDFYSDLARMQMTKDDLSKSYNQLLDYFDGVEEGSFSHYEYSGQQGNLRIFTLNYSVKLSKKSKFGQLGELIITITDDGNDYGIVSTYMKAKTQ